MNPIVLIPARMAATRLPGKPLADIGGIPMIVRVLRQAEAAGAGPVAVAAGDAAIVSAVEGAGGRAVLTDPDLPSGSDRILAALAELDPGSQHDVVINLQGDMPFLDPAALAAEVIDGLRVGYGTNPAMNLDVRSARCGVRATASRLVQALENVLVNARSVAPPDSTIDIVLRTEGTECILEVADRGPGIPPAHLERVFERFFSYRPTTSRNAAHAGLGLAIARSIVQGYGGKISARNREGGGAVFEIRLPCEAAPLPQTMQQDRHALRL